MKFILNENKVRDACISYCEQKYNMVFDCPVTNVCITEDEDVKGAYVVTVVVEEDES